MKKKDHKILAQDKRKLQKRLAPKAWADQAESMFQAVNLHYEMSESCSAHRSASQYQLKMHSTATTRS